MTQPATFDSFIAGLGRQMGVTLNPVPGMVMLDLNGVPFMLAHDTETWGEDAVMFACDFGPVPEYDRSAILEALLAANGAMHGPGSPVFTLDPNTRHAMSILTLPLEGLDPTRTILTMMRHVAVVDKWKKDYFLETATA